MCPCCLLEAHAASSDDMTRDMMPSCAVKQHPRPPLGHEATLEAEMLLLKL